MTSPALLPTQESRRLGRELSDLRGQIDTLRAGLQAAQLGKSTLYGSIPIRDSDGNLTGVIGEQADGTTGVVVTNGPPPSAPTGAVVTPLMNGLDFAWDGQLTGPTPLNLSHVILELSATSATGPWAEAGTLSAAGSIPVAPLPTTQHWGRWVAVNTSVPPGRSAPGPVGSGTPAQVVAQDVLDGIVTEVKLANDAVTAAKIAAAAVGAGEIAGNAVGLSQLASGSVDATKLIDGAVTQPKITAGAIGTNQLAANSVVAGKIAADSVTTTHLVAGSVQTAQIAAGAVLADKIAANAVTAAKIAALAITADKIDANSINAGHIQAGAVTAAKLAATLVLGNTIIAGTQGGARVQLGGFGIEAYRANGVKSLDFDTATGNMTIAGQYRSQDSGSRVEINPGGTNPDRIDLYPSSGSAKASIEATTVSSQAAITMRGNSTRSDLSAGEVYVWPSQASLRWAPPASSNPFAIVSAGQYLVQLVGPQVDIAVDRRLPNSDGSTPRVAFFQRRSTNGQIITGSLLWYQLADGEYANLQAPNQNAGIAFGPSGAFCVTNTNTAQGMHASAFYTDSAMATKTDLQPLGPDTAAATRIVDAAPAYRYRYRSDLRPRPARPDGRDADGNPLEWAAPEQPAPWHLGPIAEDLPGWMVETHGLRGTGMVNVDTKVGLLWAAHREHSRALRQLRALVEDLLAEPARPRGVVVDGELVATPTA